MVRIVIAIVLAVFALLILLGLFHQWLDDWLKRKLGGR